MYLKIQYYVLFILPEFVSIKKKNKDALVNLFYNSFKKFVKQEIQCYLNCRI